MRGKHKKLKEWVGAGLLSEDQAEAIQSYENTKKAGRFGRGLVGLSIFAILVGVVSIIASNWHFMDGGVKIGLHVLLNAVIGYAAYQTWKDDKVLWREGYTLAFFGLTLTLIALVGQVFQLDGEPAHALILWILAALPFMLIFANTHMTVVPWILAFLTTLGFGLGHYGDDWSPYWQGIIFTAFYLLIPLILIGKGVSPFMRNWKPVWADCSLHTGLVLVVIGASASSIMLGIDRWSELSQEQEFLSSLNMQRLITLLGLGLIGLHAALHNFYRHDETMKLGALFTAISLAIMSLPWFFLELYSAVAAAILFIGYWAYLGWTAQQLGHMRLISLAIIVIAIRIFIIYLEVFGSLMSTGFGLIIGGGIMLGLIWGARKLNTRLTGKAVSP